ncbi:type II toxin-antitoxin system HicB family antitoxin [uncultured Nostoc sp.]|uniref:type II toxin-antitoxin system HicB family antitoxin n=1 Tax=uncultured Nostoc sp. TaxID=340711 RepID=UPI0035C9C3E3
MEDKKYIVSLPEFGPYAHTHGNTYADALNNGEQVLELLIERLPSTSKTTTGAFNCKRSFSVCAILTLIIGTLR